MKHIPQPILERFNRTDFRVYVLRAICYQIRFERKACPSLYVSVLKRRNLLTADGELTACGMALAKRHKDYFLSLVPPEPRQMSEEERERRREHMNRMRLARKQP